MHSPAQSRALPFCGRTPLSVLWDMAGGKLMVSAGRWRCGLPPAFMAEGGSVSSTRNAPSWAERKQEANASRTATSAKAAEREQASKIRYHALKEREGKAYNLL